MNSEEFKNLLDEKRVGSKIEEWALGKDWKTFFETCYRGDWLLLLYATTTDLTIESKLRLFTLVKAHCANTIRHLMKDERIIKAVDVAMAFGEGTATIEELYAVVSDIPIDEDGYSDFCIDAAYAAVYTAINRRLFIPNSACASASAEFAADAAYNYKHSVADKTENQKLTADICRKYLPLEIWNI